MLRFLRYLAEVIAALVGITVILAMLLAWRLSTKPVNSDFLTPYIETGIESIIPDSKVGVANTQMTWDSATRTVSVRATGITVADGQGNTIADIPSLHAGISIFGLMFGQFMPKELDIDHPQIELRRTARGSFTFGGMVMTGGGDNEGKPAAEILETVFHHIEHTILMRHLAVTRAVVDIHDDATQKDWSVSIPEISIDRLGFKREGDHIDYGNLEGHIAVAVTQQDGDATLDVHYLYDAVKKQHSLSTSFNALNPAFLAGGHPETLGLGAAAIADLPLSGKIEVVFDGNLSLQAAIAQIHGDAGRLVYVPFWDKPVSVTSADFNAAYDRDARQFTISDTQANLDGVKLTLSADGVPSTQPGKDMDFTLNATVDNMPIDRYGALCPKPVLADARDWLTSNLRDGTFTHAEAQVTGSVSEKDLSGITVARANGKIDVANASVTYLDGMPAAKNVNGTAVFDLDKMTVNVASGGIGNIHIQPFALQITGLSAEDQYIDIPLKVEGPIPEILALLDHPPLGYARKLGVAPDDIRGQIAGTVDFRMPLLKDLPMSKVDINATAKATGVASDKLVSGVDISQGDFTQTLDMKGFAMKGQADLNKVPFQIAWRENFEPGKGQPIRHININGAVRDGEWDNFGIDAFDGSKGPMRLALSIDEPSRKRTDISGSVDMDAAALRVDMLNWTKPAGQNALLKFKASMPDKGNIDIKNISLTGAQVHASGSATLASDMTQILSLDMPSLIVGRTNAALHFTQSPGPDGVLSFTANGASLDVSGLRGGKDPDKIDPRPKQYNVNVGKLYTGAVGELDNVKGTAVRDRQGWRAIDLTAMAQGDTPLAIHLDPQPDGHRIFSIVSDDFGKTMEGLGFTDTIKGGKLSVTGQSSVDAPRVVNGHVKITSFTVENLPVLALLLNTLSPFGFTGILTDSTDFSRFEGDFVWQGDSITLTRAHGAGSAVGINVDGKIDMNSGRADLQGTVVPFSVVNKFLNYIPLIGNLLTGGENQGVLAVSYTIKGSLDSPKINVNPVSLLTPGFIRNLFFRDDTQDDTSSDKQ
ncbi:MAG: AsmA-like C-terminal domain-containing protein [Alphaproteobacteria bacterium]|nr:AsmA-like C-terminal domain-containing protein [Alphaproteobacteria bacterium]